MWIYETPSIMPGAMQPVAAFNVNAYDYKTYVRNWDYLFRHMTPANNYVLVRVMVGSVYLDLILNTVNLYIVGILKSPSTPPVVDVVPPVAFKIYPKHESYTRMNNIHIHSQTELRAAITAIINAFVTRTPQGRTQVQITKGVTRGVPAHAAVYNMNIPATSTFKILCFLVSEGARFQAVRNMFNVLLCRFRTDIQYSSLLEKDPKPVFDDLKLTIGNTARYNTIVNNWDTFSAGRTRFVGNHALRYHIQRMPAENIDDYRDIGIMLNDPQP